MTYPSGEVRRLFKPANHERYERLKRAAFARAKLIPPDSFGGANHLDEAEALAMQLENAYAYGDKVGWKLNYHEDKWDDPKFWEGYPSWTPPRS